MTNLLIPGSAIRCIDGCSLVEDMAGEHQLRLPYDEIPWVVFLEPGEIGLVMDYKSDEVLLLIGNKVFVLDLCEYEFNRHFESLNAA